MGNKRRPGAAASRLRGEGLGDHGEDKRNKGERWIDEEALDHGCGVRCDSRACRDIRVRRG